MSNTLGESLIKISEVALYSSDDVELIKEAVSAQWIQSHLTSGYKKLPMWKRMMTAGRVSSAKPLEVAERLVGKSTARIPLRGQVKAIRTGTNPVDVVRRSTAASEEAIPRVARGLERSPEFAKTKQHLLGIARGVRGIRRQAGV